MKGLRRLSLCAALIALALCVAGATLNARRPGARSDAPELPALSEGADSGPTRTFDRALFETVGSVVTFGACEQDGDVENGPEPIEWIVLDAAQDRALLISLNGLSCQPFHSKRMIVTWEKSSLRHWLNADFVSEAFDAGERQALVLTRVDNSRAQNYIHHTASSGSDTQDRIFLLSYQEAWRYFDSDAARAALPTARAVAEGAYVSPVNENCHWWLRSSGIYGTCAALCHYDGSRGDFLVCGRYAAVRPALWVDLTAECFG